MEEKVVYQLLMSSESMYSGFSNLSFVRKFVILWCIENSKYLRYMTLHVLFIDILLYGTCYNSSKDRYNVQYVPGIFS